MPIIIKNRFPCFKQIFISAGVIKLFLKLRLRLPTQLLYKLIIRAFKVKKKHLLPTQDRVRNKIDSLICYCTARWTFNLITCLQSLVWYSRVLWYLACHPNHLSFAWLEIKKDVLTFLPCLSRCSSCMQHIKKQLFSVIRSTTAWLIL